MKILVAGGTGAIGRPLIAELLTRGHAVVALTRSPEKARALVEQGIEPAIADALDADAVRAVVRRAEPEVVIEQLTALPRTYTRESLRAAGAFNTRLRLEGGANVLAAAQAAGVRRYLRQSIGFWAVPGPGLADEETPLAFDGSPAVAADARVVTELEQRLLGAPKHRRDCPALWLLLWTGHLVHPRWRCWPTGATAAVPDRREWRWRLVVVTHRGRSDCHRRSNRAWQSWGLSDCE